MPFAMNKLTTSACRRTSVTTLGSVEVSVTVMPLGVFSSARWLQRGSLLRFWESLSSFGGFLGGTAGALLFFRRHATPGSTWKYVDSFAYAFPFAWILGRTGCFVAYDHPGRPTAFLLGQMYKDGVVRHNLGLEEAIYTIFIAALFHVLGIRPRFSGFFLGLFMLLYAPFRFSVDFLRIVDVRYGGLTPGQYGCVALAIGGLVILIGRSRADRSGDSP